MLWAVFLAVLSRGWVISVMSQIWVVKTVLGANDLFADFLQGFRMIISQQSELERCWTCHLMGYLIKKMRINYNCQKIAPIVPMVIRRNNMAHLFQPKIQTKKTIMKEQDQWGRYENCIQPPWCRSPGQSKSVLIHMDMPTTWVIDMRNNSLGVWVLTYMNHFG